MSLSERIRVRIARWVMRRAKRAHLWAIKALLDQPLPFVGDPTIPVPDYMRTKCLEIAARELDEIRTTVHRFAFAQINEMQIAAERLARRYDPGMALNEAFKRADEKVRDEASHLALTDKQQAALKHQEEFLRRNTRQTAFGAPGVYVDSDSSLFKNLPEDMQVKAMAPAENDVQAAQRRGHPGT